MLSAYGTGGWLFLLHCKGLPSVWIANLGHIDELRGVWHDGTFRGTTARSLISVEALRRVEHDASAAAAGLAQRAAASASVAAAATPVDDEQTAARTEKIMARLLEYSGCTNLSSMRVVVAKTLWRGIAARLVWREIHCVHLTTTLLRVMVPTPRQES